MKNTNVKILAISGSLRTSSSNTNVLRAIATIAKPNISIEIFEQLGALPYFSPDIDTEDAHAAVQIFRNAIQKADAVIICTPEYAFGAPGMLKNALDWTVSSGSFSRKPLALLSASPLASGADKAHASLLLTFKALDAIIPDACKVIIPIVYKKINASAEILDESLRTELEKALDALIKCIYENKMQE